MSRNGGSKLRRSRVKIFLTGTVVGLFVFAVSQTIVGNLVSEWITNTLHSEPAEIQKRPELRLRYFVLNIGKLASPLQSGNLRKIFKDAPVYMQENAVTELLRLIYSSPAISGGRAVGKRRYVDAQQYLEAVEEEGAESPKQQSGWSDESGPIFHYGRETSCARLLRYDLLEDKLARAIALANQDRTDLFLSYLADLREQCGSYDGPPPYLEENIYFGDLRLLSLDIENIGAALPGAFSIGANVYGTEASLLKVAPLPRGESSSPDRQIVWSSPFDMFMPGEHLLVPLAILFEPKAGGALLDLRGKLLWEDRWGTRDDPKTTQWYEPNYFPQNRFLRLGPGYEISYLDAVGERESVRPFTGSTLVYATVYGAEWGSCPVVVAYQHGGGGEVGSRRVLVDAIGAGNKRRETHQIAVSAGEVELLEDEPEISYIDLFVVRGRAVDGTEVTCITVDERLQQEDDEYLLLRQGESLRVSCDRQIMFPEVTVSGYYERVGVFGNGTGIDGVAAGHEEASLPGR